MSPKPVVVSLLWQKNESVVERLAHAGVELFVAMDYAITASLVAKLQAVGAGILRLEHYIDEGTRGMLWEEAGRKVAASASALEREFAALESASPRPAQRPIATLVARDLQQRLFESMLVVEGLARVAERHTVRGMLLNETETAGWKTAALWAKQAGVPRFLVSHGVTLGNAHSVVRQMDAEHLLVFGSRGGEPYLDQGADPSVIHVVGNPAWDTYPDLIARRAEIRAELERIGGFRPGLPVICFATTWSGRMTSLVPDEVVDDTIRMFLTAIARLEADGIAVNAIVKGRPSNSSEAGARVAAIAAEVGCARYAFLTGDMASVVVASDAIVASESSTLIEGMMCGIPAINLRPLPAWIIGPSFGAGDGLVQVDLHDVTGLTRTLRRLVTDLNYRTDVCAAQTRRAPFFIAAVDGKSAQRCADFILPRLARANVLDLPKRYAWQKLSSPDEPGDSAAMQTPRIDIITQFAAKPRRVLDIGCGAGATGAEIKRRFPQAWVSGIEPQAQLAKHAAGRIDAVIAGPLEGADFGAAGIVPQSIDTVICTDVLARLRDPWGMLMRLRPYLAADARIYATVPNFRNLWLLTDILVSGAWTYGDGGVLDVASLRFFTAASLRELFIETGYAVERFDRIADRRSQGIQVPANGTLDVNTPRLSIKQVTTDDLRDLTAAGFSITARMR